MGRTPCCSKMGLNRGPWTPQEDELLANYIQKHGEGRWRTLPKKAGLLRCGKSCRLRWMNYLRPDVKRGQILPDEEDLIIRLHRLLGNRWSLIAGRIPGRTDNEIKNYWNTHLSKKLVSQGIDPRNHKPLADAELDNIHAAHNSDNNNNNNNVGVDSENKLSSAASDSPDNYPQTGIVDDNSEASTKVVIVDHLSPDIINDSMLPADSVTGTLNHGFNGAPQALNTVLPPVFQDTASNGAVNMDPTLIPYSNAPSVVAGLQDHDASLYLRKNSITNSYFVAPPMTDSSLKNIASFPSSIAQDAPYEGFPMNCNQSDVQQSIDINPVAPGANAEDDNSDIFSYFLDSFMNGDQLQNEPNKHAAPSGSENRQQFSHGESMNQHGYDMWSFMSPASQYP